MNPKGSSSAAKSLSSHIEHLFQTHKTSTDEQLTQLLALLDLHTIKRAAALHSNLKPTFQDAKAQNINLLHPGDKQAFHTWLLTGPLARIGDELGAAKPNTINSRATALSRLYRRLIELNYLEENPLDGIILPKREQDLGGLLRKTEIRKVSAHLAAEKDDDMQYLHAAFLLIYELAFKVTDVLSLTWEQVDLPQRRLLRATESQFSDELMRALQTLSTAPGALLTPADRSAKVIPLDEQTFRLRYGKAFWKSNVTFSPPSRLRLAGLRDHPGKGVSARRADQAGYLDAGSYQKAMKQVQQVAAATSVTASRRGPRKKE